MASLTIERFTATAYAGDARPNTTFRAGRVCAEAGCTTRLSIYNRATECSVHEQVRAYYVRGKRAPRVSAGPKGR